MNSEQKFDYQFIESNTCACVCCRVTASSHPLPLPIVFYAMQFLKGGGRIKTATKGVWGKEFVQ